MQINILIGTIIASYETGAVSFLYYADRIYQLPLALIGIAIGIVLLPSISKKIKENNKSSINKTIEKTIKIGEEVDEADVLNTSMQFLYQESNNLFFMNLESYEQLELATSSVDFDPRWLNDGDECDVTLWNDAIIDVNLPNLVTCKVTSTESVAKGDTVSTTLKDAELDNGITIKVPAFIKQDEEIKVNPTTGEYSSRA